MMMKKTLFATLFITSAQATECYKFSQYNQLSNSREYSIKANSSEQYFYTPPKGLKCYLKTKKLPYGAKVYRGEVNDSLVANKSCWPGKKSVNLEGRLQNTTKEDFIKSCMMRLQIVTEVTSRLAHFEQWYREYCAGQTINDSNRYAFRNCVQKRKQEHYLYNQEIDYIIDKDSLIHRYTHVWSHGNYTYMQLIDLLNQATKKYVQDTKSNEYQNCSEKVVNLKNVQIFEMDFKRANTAITGIRCQYTGLEEAFFRKKKILDIIRF